MDKPKGGTTMPTKTPTIHMHTVTPAKAQEWLDRSNPEVQRHVSTATVAFYVEEMKAKRWQLSNDAIAIDVDGNVINGQHRLRAVVAADMGCTFWVMENCDPSVREVLDIGRARSVPDMMKMIYGTERARLVTGAIRIIDDFVFDRRIKLSVGHAYEMSEHFGDGFRWAVGLMPGKGPFAPATIAAALVYAYKTAPSSVDLFAKRLLDGADLATTNPVLVVRNQIQKIPSLNYRDQKRDVFLILLHAIHKTIRGDHVNSKAIRVREEMVAEFGRVYGRNLSKKVA